MSLIDLNVMRSATAWEDQTTLKRFCATQLLTGRLSLVLGAGVSMGCDLPDWKTLVDRCFEDLKLPRPANMNDEVAAEFLLTDSCGDDERRFADLVHGALYRGYALTGIALSKVDLVAALGALVTPSVRGGVRRVISFNFDDLLEQFLASFGVCVDSPWKVPTWDSRSDVRVYHPHGFLPYDKGRGLSKGIVMAQSQYDRIVGNMRELWYHALLDVFRTTTCLFIGLSGTDPNLRNLLMETKTTHVTCNDHPFWGVRFSKSDDDPNKMTWQNRGVLNLNVDDYRRIPGWLFEVCQLAATMTMGR